MKIKIIKPWLLFTLITTCFLVVWTVFVDMPSSGGIPKLLGFNISALIIITPVIYVLKRMFYKLQKNKKIIFTCILIFGLCVNHSYAQGNQNQWEEEMISFDVLDGNSPQQKGILFTGSSSIKFWKDPAKDFYNPMILNRGFGGSQIIDLIENFDQVILKYRPKKIVIYSGDNDIQSGKTAEIVYGDFCTLYGMIRAKLPDAMVYYIAIKPSLSRWSKVLEMKKANTMINEFLNIKKNGYYVDVFSPMIGLDGLPQKKWFVEDGLHMTKEGYQLWIKILAPYLKEE